MIALSRSGRLLGIAFVLLNLLSLSMGSISCTWNSPGFLCGVAGPNRRGDNDPVDDVLIRSYASRTSDTRQLAQEKEADEIRSFLRSDRSLGGSANSEFESGPDAVADWSGIIDGQPGAGSQNEETYLISDLEEPRQRRKTPRKSNLLDPTYMMMGIGKRRR